MEKIKSIITGILSVAVFFMAVQVGLAQESLNTPSDKTEMKSVNSSLAERADLVAAFFERPHSGSLNLPRWIKNGLQDPSLQDPDVYFQFIGNPGEENDPTKWVETTGPGDCETGDEACVVLMRAEFVDHDASPKTIIASLLPNQEMPVIPTTGLNQVPDPTAAGTGSSQPYTSETEIYNRN